MQLRTLRTVTTAILIALSPACGPAAGTVIVETEPPPPQNEVVAMAPYPGAVWIGGYWQWNGGRYVWIAGHWERHRPGWLWVPHHWERRGRAWHYVRGRWRRV